MTGCSPIGAMIFSSPPQFGHCSRSSSKEWDMAIDRARSGAGAWFTMKWTAHRSHRRRRPVGLVQWRPSRAASPRVDP